MVGKSILQGIAFPAPHLFGEKRNRTLKKPPCFFNVAEN